MSLKEGDKGNLREPKRGSDRKVQIQPSFMRCFLKGIDSAPSGQSKCDWPQNSTRLKKLRRNDAVQDLGSCKGNSISDFQKFSNFRSLEKLRSINL